MASDLNTVALVGRLTRDADMKYSNAGGAIVRLSIAVNRSRKTQDGRWEDEANFFDCVYFGRGAEAVSQYLTKGRQVAIQGELRQDRWEQDGQSRSRVEIYVNNLTLVGGQGNGGSNGGYAGQSQRGNGGGYSNGGYNNGGSQSQGSWGQQNNSWNGGNNGGYNRGNTRPQMADPAPQEMHGGPEDFSDDSIPF